MYFKTRVATRGGGGFPGLYFVQVPIGPFPNPSTVEAGLRVTVEARTRPPCLRIQVTVPTDTFALHSQRRAVTGGFVAANRRGENPGADSVGTERPVGGGDGRKEIRSVPLRGPVHRAARRGALPHGRSPRSGQPAVAGVRERLQMTRRERREM